MKEPEYIPKNKALEIVQSRLDSCRSGSLEYQRLFSIKCEILNIPALTKEQNMERITVLEER